MLLTTFLMFEGRAEEAMNFYVSVFDGSKIVSIERFGPEGPGKEGSVLSGILELGGHRLRCFDSPVKHAFTFTPAISLFISDLDEVTQERIFNALSDKGQVLMPLAEYPGMKRFAWVQDRFGVSWQLSLS